MVPPFQAITRFRNTAMFFLENCIAISIIDETKRNERSKCTTQSISEISKLADEKC